MQNLLILLTIECFCLGNILFKQFVVWKEFHTVSRYQLFFKALLLTIIIIRIARRTSTIIWLLSMQTEAIIFFSKAIVIRCIDFFFFAYINFQYFFFFLSFLSLYFMIHKWILYIRDSLSAIRVHCSHVRYLIYFDWRLTKFLKSRLFSCI